MELANRIVSLPMYLALPDRDNEVNELVLEYYDEMARSGASIIVPGRMSKARLNAQSHAARRNLTLARVVVARVDPGFRSLGNCRVRTMISSEPNMSWPSLGTQA